MNAAKMSAAEPERTDYVKLFECGPEETGPVVGKVISKPLEDAGCLLAFIVRAFRICYYSLCRFNVDLQIIVAGPSL